MLKHAPSVYIPHQPDDDDITLPTVLSLVVHSAIIGFIVYSHHVPKIETPPAIETSIVTPAELAAMKAAVLDNREALAAAGTQTDQSQENANSESPDATTATAPNTSRPKESVSDSIRRRVPIIFSRSTDEADDFETTGYVDPDVKEALAKRRETNKQMMEAFNRQQMEKAAGKIDDYSAEVDADYLAELKKLEAFKKTEKNPAKTDKPKRVEVSVPSSLSHNDSNSRDAVKADSSTGKTISLGDDSSQSPSKPGGAPGGAANKPSASSISSALVAHIKPYWHPPSGRIGKSLKVIIDVDASGNVLTVAANSDDAALNNSLEQAVRDASPLTPVVGSDFTVLKPTFKVTQ